MEHDCDKNYQEELLQDVVHRWPSILPVLDFYPGVTDLIPLGREIPVDMGGSIGCIDNLFVTNDAHLVLVETKLWRNPEATRKVIAQTLQYGMAVSKLSLDEFEECLRHSLPAPKGSPLGPDGTVLQRVTDIAAQGSLMEIADDFEAAFDRSRRDGEILLLIVTDGIHSSAERLVQWMNKVAGSAPYKFGLVELSIFDLADGGRIIVPKTMLRITEASRHVVIITTERPKEDFAVTVVGPGSVKKEGSNSAPKAITDEALTARIRAQNPLEVSETVEALRSQLRAASPKTRSTPTSIQYGADVDGDFIPLVSFGNTYVWFQIPMRAVRVLGDERFISCKQKINSVADFYRPEDVSDPKKTNALTPHYKILLGKGEAFVKAFSEIVQIVRDAVTEAS